MIKIHIGYPKTASTYLQKCVFTQLKYHTYIGHKEFVKSGLFDLLWRIERSVDYEKIRNYFKGETFFISFEEILGPSMQGAILMDEIPLRLIKALGKEQKILITIRRQDDLIRSLYLQYIHLGGTLKIKKLVNNRVYGQNRLETDAYDFLETYKLYARIFGKENIKVIPYETLLTNTDKFKNDLENFFSNETFDINKIKIMNKSVKGYQFKFLRFLNIFLSSWLSEKYIISNKLIDQNKFRLKLQESNFLRFGKTLNSSDEYFLRSLLESYYESNKELDLKLNLDLKKYGYY